MAMSRKTEESIVPGPAQEDGAFILIGPDQIDDAPPEDEDPELALGSDVHDVEDLERRARFQGLDEMLKAYLLDDKT